jgi:hypothetical protein
LIFEVLTVVNFSPFAVPLPQSLFKKYFCFFAPLQRSSQNTILRIQSSGGVFAPTPTLETPSYAFGYILLFIREPEKDSTA